MQLKTIKLELQDTVVFVNQLTVKSVAEELKANKVDLFPSKTAGKNPALYFRTSDGNTHMIGCGPSVKAGSKINEIMIGVTANDEAYAYIPGKSDKLMDSVIF